MITPEARTPESDAGPALPTHTRRLLVAVREDEGHCA